MHLAMAPFTLKPGVTEADLVAASDDFDGEFAQQQDGIARRLLVQDETGRYADIVLFHSTDAMARVIRAEQEDPACARFMGLLEPGSVAEFRVLRTYG